MRMLNERQREILTRIEETGLQSINHLSDHFQVATQTIRRDINDLCDKGLARRVHGGVVAPSLPENLTFHARQVLNEAAKRRIAQEAARVIPHGATVMLGVGTTVRYVAEALLDHADMTIVTNNLEVAMLCCGASSAKVHFAAGELRAEDRDIVGSRTLAEYRRYSASFGVIGAGALSESFGVHDFKAFDAELGQTIVASCERTLLVAEHSKWDRIALHKVAPFEAIDTLITDELPADLHARDLRVSVCIAAKSDQV